MTLKGRKKSKNSRGVTSIKKKKPHCKENNENNRYARFSLQIVNYIPFGDSFLICVIYISISKIKAPVNNDHISIDSDDEESSMEVKASNVSTFLQQSDGDNDMSESCDVSDDNDSKDK